MFWNILSYGLQNIVDNFHLKEYIFSKKQIKNVSFYQHKYKKCIFIQKCYEQNKNLFIVDNKCSKNKII